MQGQTKEQEGKKMYSYPGGKAEAAKKRGLSLILVGVISCLFWMAGSYTCAGIVNDYVILPWLLCLFPLVYCWLAVIKLFRCGESMTEADCRKGQGRMWRSSFLLSAASGFSTVGSVWFLMTGTYTSISLEIGLVIRMGMLWAASLISMFLHKKQLSQLIELPN